LALSYHGVGALTETLACIDGAHACE